MRPALALALWAVGTPLTLASVGDRAAAAQTSASAYTQVPPSAEFPRHKYDLGLAGALAVPVGEFRDYIGVGWSFDGHVSYHPRGNPLFGIRLDVLYTIYGRETVRRPLSPTIPFVDVDVTTENGIVTVGLGPEFVLSEGRWRPYLHLTVGVGEFSTDTQVEGTDSPGQFATTTNFEDYTMAIRGGGGVRVAILDGYLGEGLWLNLGTSFAYHGHAEYLREGGMTLGPNGEILFDVTRSQANLVSFTLGVTIAFN